jgi:hypothetical protein
VNDIEARARDRLLTVQVDGFISARQQKFVAPKKVMIIAFDA